MISTNSLKRPNGIKLHVQAQILFIIYLKIILAV